MVTTTRKIEFNRKDEKGDLLPAYEVLVDGESLGMVWKERVRHNRMSGRVIVGWTYSTEWRWSTRIHAEFPSFKQYLGKRTKAAAVDALLVEVSKVAK